MSLIPAASALVVSARSRQYGGSPWALEPDRRSSLFIDGEIGSVGCRSRSRPQAENVWNGGTKRHSNAARKRPTKERVPHADEFNVGYFRAVDWRSSWSQKLC